MQSSRKTNSHLFEGKKITSHPTLEEILLVAKGESSADAREDKGTYRRGGNTASSHQIFLLFEQDQG